MSKMDSILTKINMSKIARKAFCLLVGLVTAVNTLATPVAAVFDGMPVCGIQEHTHSAACYTANSSIICGLEESEEHTHSEGCYFSESILTCQIPEHIHAPSCYLQQSSGNETGGVASTSNPDDSSQNIPAENTPPENIPSEDVPTPDVPSENDPSQDIPTEDNPLPNLPSEDNPTPDFPAEDDPS